MRRLILSFLGLAIVVLTLFPYSVTAAQRRRAVVRHPIRHTRLVVDRRHPVHRALPATVVVRPARTTVVVGAPLVFLPLHVWTAAVISMPPGDRLVWQDSEVIERDEEWVDTNFGIDRQGTALLLQIRGTAQLNFADVTFANGNVQVVDFNDRPYKDGTYTLLDFADGRHVKTVRILGKSHSEDTKLSVALVR